MCLQRRFLIFPLFLLLACATFYPNPSDSNEGPINSESQSTNSEPPEADEEITFPSPSADSNSSIDQDHLLPEIRFGILNVRKGESEGGWTSYSALISISNQSDTPFYFSEKDRFPILGFYGVFSGPFHSIILDDKDSIVVTLEDENYPVNVSLEDKHLFPPHFDVVWIGSGDMTFQANIRFDVPDLLTPSFITVRPGISIEGTDINSVPITLDLINPSPMSSELVSSVIIEQLPISIQSGEYLNLDIGPSIAEIDYSDNYANFNLPIEISNTDITQNQDVNFGTLLLVDDAGFSGYNTNIFSFPESIGPGQAETITLTFGVDPQWIFYDTDLILFLYGLDWTAYVNLPSPELTNCIAQEVLPDSIYYSGYGSDVIEDKTLSLPISVSETVIVDEDHPSGAHRINFFGQSRSWLNLSYEVDESVDWYILILDPSGKLVVELATYIKSSQYTTSEIPLYCDGLYSLYILGANNESVAEYSLAMDIETR